MTEAKSALEATLTELHRALDSSDDLDTEARQELEQAVAHIRAVLGDSDEGSDGLHPSVRERLQRAVERFEESHPQLTAGISRVIDALSEMGI